MGPACATRTDDGTILAIEEAAGARLRAVIADDAPAMRALLRRVLEDSEAFDVVGEARNGEEAVEIADTFQPDVVLLDVAMPVLDGLAAIPLLRLVSPASRIVVLSAMDASRVSYQALASGADVFIEKGVLPESLARRVIEACRLPAVRSDGGPTPSPAAGWCPPPGDEHFQPDPFRLAFAHAAIGMALLDREGRFQEVNEAFCRMLSRPAVTLVDTDIDDISHPGDVARHDGLRLRLLPSRGDGSTEPAELRLMRSDGQYLWTTVTWSLLPAGDGSPAGFVVQVVDITERKVAEVILGRAEEMRARDERELGRARADLARFATVAAHDLRSPLQVISGFGALLRDTQGDVLDERGKEFLSFILKSATRMNVLIDDLLAYAKVGADHRSPEAVPLDGVVVEVRASLVAEITSTGASVESEPLPVLTGDPAQFAQLLHHLVTNGLKFAVDGVAPRIRLSASRMANAWCIDVTDNGVGIPLEHRAHVFGIFQRLGRTDREGTGIGLAICQRIIEQRGGSIWVEENAEGGCRFRFTVPDELEPSGQASGPDAEGERAGSGRAVIAAPPMLPAPVVNDPDPGPHPDADLDAVPAWEATSALEVLLVEDDDDHARLVEATLGRGPDGAYRLRRAHDLAGARTELQSHRTDCILLDLFLPDGQGLEALAQLTTLEPLVPIVILTSLADEQLGLQAVHEGAQDYLVKGTIDGPRLSRSLRHAVERKALEARFAEQALHDPLTGLANRTLLFDRLRLEIARSGRSGAGVAVFYLDVDGFKGINDQWGHDAGDGVLVQVARRLSGLVRPGDTVGRIGGDEFVVVCCGLETEADVDHMQARIEEAVRRPMLLGGGTEVVTASIGAAVGKGPAEEPEAIISRADEAMYQAKRRRRLAHRTLVE